MKSASEKSAVRKAKKEAKVKFGHLQNISSIGIGLTKDRNKYAVMITVADEETLALLPEEIAGIPIRANVTSLFKPLEIGLKAKDVRETKKK